MANEMNEQPGGDPIAAEGSALYHPPQVIVYSEEELLEQIGPVKACTSSFNAFAAGAPYSLRLDEELRRQTLVFLNAPSQEE